MMKKTADSKKMRLWCARVVLLLLGLCIAHLGVTLFLLTNLGADPFNVLIQGLFRSIPWPGGDLMTHGRVHLLVSLLILLILLVVDRKSIGVGTVLCMALGGPIIDIYSLFLAPLVHSGLNMAMRLVLLVLGCVILAFGMTVVITSQAGTGPNDLVAVVLSKKLRKPFGAVRVIVDFIFALTGFSLGGVLGVGTIICAFVVGPAAQLFFPISRRICDGGTKIITGGMSLPGGEVDP